MPKSVIRVVCAAISQQGRYLITQRKQSAVLPLLWEFPGGRVEDGESDQAALKRELLYRLGIEVDVEDVISETHREYATYIVSLTLYRCALGELPARPLMVRDLRWVPSDEFDLYEFTPADEHAMNAMLFTERQPN